MASCLEYAKERSDECAAWENQGYKACGTWSPWFSWLCIFWTWVSKLVCIGYVWITTGACLVWDTVTTVVDAVVDVVEALVGWFLNILAAIVNFVFAIPYVGRVLQWVWNLAITAAWWMFLGLPDAALFIIGIRPEEKKLRLCTIVCRDEAGLPVAPIEHVVAIGI